MHTGPRYDLAVRESPLLRQLQGDGLLQRDPLGLGIHTDAQYQLMDDAGRSVPNLYYLGPLLKAQRWEAMAVPELRVHSQPLVRAMLAAVVMIAASHAHDVR